MAISEKNFQTLLKVAVENKASDIHLREGESPAFRIRGDLTPIKSGVLSKEDFLSIFKLLNIKKIPDDKIPFERDGSYEVSGVCRVRHNSFRFSGKFGIILRIIQLEIPSIESLGLPVNLSDLTKPKAGITLVTGPTGSGKSSTLTSLINYINENQKRHIISIEDPIEFIHQSQKSKISQREIGLDTETFKSGLRASLRQDPDVILIGEMRDTETIEIALKASETGHHIFSTLHTSNAASTINRIISMFPPEEQQNIRLRLADSLNAVIGQKLVPSFNGKKIYPIQEIMINGPGIKECILGKEDLSRINQIIYEGGKSFSSKTKLSSISFDQSLMRLYNASKISKETILQFSENPDDLEKSIMFE
tara:strand:- start:4389 stop:5483 length:1095 start_codon:yes stop_codon:yes gene_type:complete